MVGGSNPSGRAIIKVSNTVSSKEESSKQVPAKHSLDDLVADESGSLLSRYQKDAIDLSGTINQGQKIVDLRQLAGITIEELELKAKIPRKDLLAIEAGLLEINQTQAKQIAEAIGVRVTDIL